MVRRPSKSQLVKSFSLEELRAALEGKLAKDGKILAKLRAKREILAAKLAQVTGDIESIEGAPAGAPAPEPKKRPGRKPGAKKAARKAAAKPAAKPAVKKQAPAKKPAGRGRAKGKMSLAQAIAQVLSESKERMAPKEIRAAVIDQKLIPNISKSFVQQVANTLSRGDQFKRAKDGTYSV
jgi:hypothetical protein